MISALTVWLLCLGLFLVGFIVGIGIGQQWERRWVVRILRNMEAEKKEEVELSPGDKAAADASMSVAIGITNALLAQREPPAESSEPASPVRLDRKHRVAVHKRMQREKQTARDHIGDILVSQ